jgi:predicted kinase
MRRVPVMLISGAVGVGKTTVAYEVRLRLKDANVSHVFIDDEFALFHPHAADDPHGERVRNAALASLWEVYRNANVQRLILARAIADAETLVQVAAAIPEAEIDLYWLVAPLDVIEERIRRREVPTAYASCVQRAAELLEQWGRAPLAARVIETASKSTSEIAYEIVAP